MKVVKIKGSKHAKAYIHLLQHTNTHTNIPDTYINNWVENSARQGWCHVIVKVSYVTPKNIIRYTDKTTF